MATSPASPFRAAEKAGIAPKTLENPPATGDPKLAVPYAIMVPPNLGQGAALPSAKAPAPARLYPDIGAEPGQLINLSGVPIAKSFRVEPDGSILLSAAPPRPDDSAK
jgi:hypothetical protein